MSRDGTAAKNEVVVSTRRQWPQEQKLAILAEVDAAGGSVSQVARRHGLRSSLLFRWRRDFRKVLKPAVPNFVPVRLAPPPATAQARSGAIEVVLANGRTVRIGAAGRQPRLIVEAACWAHGQRKLFDLARLRKMPIAIEDVRRIDELFAIEREINGQTSDKRLHVRRERSKPLVE